MPPGITSGMVPLIDITVLLTDDGIHFLWCRGNGPLLVTLGLPLPSHRHQRGRRFFAQMAVQIADPFALDVVSIMLSLTVLIDTFLPVDRISLKMLFRSEL